MTIPHDHVRLAAAIQLECARSRFLVEEVGPAMRQRVTDARGHAALVAQAVWLRRMFGTWSNFLASALGDEEVAIGAAWVLQFGPIETDEQFAAIVQTVKQARGRRA